MKPVHSFVVTANLPKRISKLKELAYNYWWCWNSDARELFIRINRSLWEEVNHNPVLLINKTPQETLQKLSEQVDFTSYLDFIHDKFSQYMNANTWFKSKIFCPMALLHTLAQNMASTRVSPTIQVAWECFRATI